MTMVQRSPTYVVARPSSDAIADFLRAKLPAQLAHNLVRWKNVAFGLYFYNLQAQAGKGEGLPAEVGARAIAVRLATSRRILRRATSRGTSGSASSPTAISSRRSARTARASQPTRSSASPKGTEADRRQGDRGRRDRGGDRAVPAAVRRRGTAVDGRKVELSKTLNYKGMMFSDVPNLAATFGYTNASWTLKADLIGEYVCRILNAMEAKKKTHRRRAQRGY